MEKQKQNKKNDAQNRGRMTFFFFSPRKKTFLLDERRGKHVSFTPEASGGEQFWVENKTHFSILFFPNNRGDNQLERTSYRIIPRSS